MENYFTEIIKRNRKIQAEAKEFAIPNFNAIVIDLTAYEKNKTNPFGESLQKVFDILVQIEEIYTIADVYALLSEIKLERLYVD